MFKISHVLQSVRDRGIALWYEKLAVSVRSRVTLSRWQRVPLAPLKPIEFVLGTSSRRLSLLSGY